MREAAVEQPSGPTQAAHDPAARVEERLFLFLFATLVGILQSVYEIYGKKRDVV